MTTQEWHAGVALQIMQNLQKFHWSTSQSSLNNLKAGFTDLWMIVLPSFVFFLQSFHWVNVVSVCSGSRHFESERAWVCGISYQQLTSIKRMSLHIWLVQPTKWRRVPCLYIAPEVCLYFRIRNCDASALKVIPTPFMFLWCWRNVWAFLHPVMAK